MKLRVTATALNLRVAPDVKSQAIAVLPKNAEIETLAPESNGWVKVRTSNGRTGYVSVKYTAPSEDFPWMTFARAEIGVKEYPSERHNLRILEYHKATSLRATSDETPWCSAFVNWCLQQAGILGTNSAAAKSFLKWGREIKDPVPGCIVVLKRGGHAWNGHVAFYLGKNNLNISLLGGNQSNRVKVGNYHLEDVLSYRLPE